MNIYYINLLLLYLIETGIKNLDMEKHPIYIHFLNCETNNIPEFLSNKKEVCVVLQRQFEDLEIDYRYLSVTLSINDIRHRLNIDLSTVFAIDIVDITKIEFEPRLQNEYTYDVINILDDIYMKEMKEYISSHQKFLKEININLIPRSVNENNIQKENTNIISIDDVLKNKK